tara:strand:+ start:84 stop:233 length:150 start_codon:yes stop_codon:yes gene_type:complete
MTAQEDIAAIENIENNITIREAICKELFGDDVNHEDYTNEQIISKLGTT